MHATPAAIDHLRSLLREGQASATHGLRLGVEKGGCAGWQYVMKIDAPEPADHVVEQDGVRFIFDPQSHELLGDIRLDYVDSLNDAGFKIDNPRAVRSCGCGTSFETTPAPAH